MCIKIDCISLYMFKNLYTYRVNAGKQDVQVLVARQRQTSSRQVRTVKVYSDTLTIFTISSISKRPNDINVFYSEHYNL